jgi:FdhD protein
LRALVRLEKIGATMSARAGSKGEAEVLVFDAGRPQSRSDDLVTEEPLEIRLRAAAAGGDETLAMHGSPAGAARQRTVAVTMRTPGADFELAAGFLFGEGVIREPAEIAGIAHCDDPGIDDARRANVVNVKLRSAALPDLDALQRHFHMTSACGVCGKTSLDALRITRPATIAAGPAVDAEVLTSLPEKLRSGQGLFGATGGLHAAALFDARGRLLAVREDVGRHNAVDKVVGWAFLDGRLPLAEHILMVSGRTSFEILQKAVMAGVPVVCAVSAPSTLAVSVAREFGVTLIGFLRGERFNVYAGAERVKRA